MLQGDRQQCYIPYTKKNVGNSSLTLEGSETIVCVYIPREKIESDNLERKLVAHVFSEIQLDRNDETILLSCDNLESFCCVIFTSSFLMS